MNKTLISASALLLLCTSCSSFSRRNQDAEAPQESDAQKIERLQSQNKELSNSLTSITTKLQVMESRLASMTEKLEASARRMDNVVENQRAKPAPVKTLPTEGATHLPPAGDDDAEAAFTSNEPVRKYRQAMILFQSHNYPDASLGFSAFVDQYPDHALAGSAQFYLGETYFKQKEYKLAARELGRVITTYDRSPHIAETLRDLSISEEKIGMPEEAARHRQLLTSLFPHSPAAHSAHDVAASASDVDAAPESAPEGSHEDSHESSKPRVVISPKAGAHEAHEAPASQGASSQIDSVPATSESQHIGHADEEKAPSSPSANGPAIDAPPPTAPMAPSGPAEPETK
ncbi:MAG: tetratricopeptide repeat protein [Bdellovibrionia bacterium]